MISIPVQLWSKFLPASYSPWPCALLLPGLHPQDPGQPLAMTSDGCHPSPCLTAGLFQEPLIVQAAVVPSGLVSLLQVSMAIPHCTRLSSQPGESSPMCSCSNLQGLASSQQFDIFLTGYLPLLWDTNSCKSGTTCRFFLCSLCLVHSHIPQTVIPSSSVQPHLCPHRHPCR